MKPLRLALLACCVASASSAAEPASASTPAEEAASLPPPPLPRALPKTVWPRVELTDGRILERARATNTDALSVTFAHSGGITKVDRRLLPAELATVFPFDPAEAGRAARVHAAERVAAAEEQSRREAEARRSATTTVPSRPTHAPAAPAAEPAPDPEVLAATVRARARRYFEDEKRTGSGATLVFSLATELDDPEPVSGWDHRWEIKGIASYKVYDSLGWGSFSSRTRKFRAQIEAPPGKTPKVVSFDER